MKITMPDQKIASQISDNSAPSSQHPSVINVEEAQKEGDEEDEASTNKWYKCRKILWKIFTSQLGLIVLLLCYSFAGAAIFKAIEGPREKQEIEDIANSREIFIKQSFLKAQLFNNSEDFRPAMEELLDEYEVKLTYMINHGISAGQDNVVWDYWGSLFFCATIFTTIGYGHITPATSWGRVATMIYAIIGIPLFLVIMGKLGKHLTTLLKFIWKYVRMCYYARCCRVMRSNVRHSAFVVNLKAKLTCKKPPEGEDEAGDQSRPSSTSNGEQRHSQVIAQMRQVSQGNLTSSSSAVPSISTQDLITADDDTSIDDFELDDDFNLPPIVAFSLTALYIFLGALMYTRWEPWTYLEAFYFLFVSVSTIGFGDLVPQHPKYFLASSAYIILGLALVAMMINVLMEFFNRTIELAREKVAVVGRHIGLDIDGYECRNKTPSPTMSRANETLQKGIDTPCSDSLNSSHGLLENEQAGTRRKKPKRRKPSEVDLATPASIHRSTSITKKSAPKRSSKESASEEGLENEAYKKDDEVFKNDDQVTNNNDQSTAERDSM